MYGLKYGPKLGKPLRIEKNKNGKTPKLDNARRLRGIYFVDPEDEEYKEIIQNARRKLELQMEAAMPCKKKTKNMTCLQETVGRLGAHNKALKTKYACTVS